MNISFRAAVLVLGLLAAGCAARAASPSTLYHDAGLGGVLQEYDRQIAALRATLHPKAFANSTADVDAAIAGMRSELQESATTIDALIAQKADEYALRQDEAVSAVLATADGQAPSRTDVAQRMRKDYRAEYAQLRSGAERDMKVYERALLQQQRESYAEFVAAVQNRTQQAFFYRAQELREREADLLLDLARRDAPRRTILRARLQTLALSDQSRAQLRSTLNEIQQREDRAFAPIRARDARTLQAYRSSLIAKGARDIALMNAQLQVRTQANLAARRDVFAEQRAQTMSLPLNPNAGGASRSRDDLRARVAVLRGRGASEFRSEAQEEIDAYNAAREDLANRFATVRDRDSQSLKSTLAAIAQLERDRAALAARINSY